MKGACSVSTLAWTQSLWKGNPAANWNSYILLGGRSDGEGGLSSQSLVSKVMCNFQESAFLRMVATSCLIGVKEEGEEEQKQCGSFKMFFFFEVTKEAIGCRNSRYLIVICCFTNGLCQIIVGLYCMWRQWNHTAKADLKSYNYKKYISWFFPPSVNIVCIVTIHQFHTYIHTDKQVVGKKVRWRKVKVCQKSQRIFVL